MVNSHHEHTATNSNSRSSAGSTTRKSRRSSTSRNKSGTQSISLSPIRNRSEPRRSKRSKEDLEAKEKARAERDISGNNAPVAELAAVDLTGAVEGGGRSSNSNIRNNPRKSKRRSQQVKVDRGGIMKDAHNVAKAKDLINRSSNQPNIITSPPTPGAHADSRGDQVIAKDKSNKSGNNTNNKGRFSRPLGTQSVFTMEERTKMEKEKKKNKQGGEEEQGEGIIMASKVDETHDEALAMHLLNTMLDEMEEENNKNKSMMVATNTKKKTPLDKKLIFSDQENKEEVDEKDWENSMLSKGVRIFRYLLCAVVFGAAIIGTWIALRGRDNDNVMSGPSSVGENVTEPSASPSDSPSNFPSTAPTFLDLYEPPDEDFCRLVSQNRTTAEEREGLEQANFGLTFDVTLETAGDITAPQIFTFAKAIQDKLAPRLLGCGKDVSRRHLEENSMIRGAAHTRHQRKLGLGKNRYIIADAFVTGKEIEQECTKTRFPDQCHTIFVDLSVFLKNPIRLRDIIVLISETVEELEDKGADDFNLKKPLSLEYPFFNVQLTDIDSLSPTTAPSMMPTNIPSIPPTTMPVASDPTARPPSPNSNSGADVIFEPPSEEDCAAITNGGTIQGQDTMPIQSYLLDLDVTTFLPMDLSISAGIIEEKLREMLTSEITGCNPDTAGSFSYAIANVMVGATFGGDSGVSNTCLDDVSNPQCHRVSVTLDIVVRDDSVRVAAVITELSLFLGGGVLANKLELAELYESIKVANLGSTRQNIYEANSAPACENISIKESVPNQDTMTARSFDIRFDVSLSLQLSDVSEVVEEMEKRMQRIMAPKLAECPDSRRRWLNEGYNRKLAIERNVVGNAQFVLEYQPDQVCDASAPTAYCIRVLAKVNLYLKGFEDTLPLANHITGILSSEDLRIPLGLTAPFNNIELVGFTVSAPTSSPSSSPSSSPTTFSIYEVNSAPACENISIKESVPNQDTMTARSFDIRFDVSLTLQLSDLSEVVKEMESRMQRIMAPKLAECPDSRRRWLNDGYNRKLAIERNVLGNAQFFLEYQPDQVCDASAPTPCIRVLARLNLYLKGIEDTLPLVNHITGILNSEDLTTTLGLTAPFNNIELVGLTASVPTSSPSSSPSNFPTTISAGSR